MRNLDETAIRVPPSQMGGNGQFHGEKVFSGFFIIKLSLSICTHLKIVEVENIYGICGFCVEKRQMERAFNYPATVS